MRPAAIALVLTGSMFVMPVAALAQQSETGPGKQGSETPQRSGEMYPWPERWPRPAIMVRDVTKGAEPGKKKSPDELRQTGESRFRTDSTAATQTRAAQAAAMNCYQ